jgi:hypothetical protein
LTPPYNTEEDHPISDIISNQFERYPGMQPDDLYKLLYQGAMGCEHAIDDPAVIRKYLMHELQELSERHGEPLFEPISPDGDIVRVNLRPFIEMNMDIELLLQAFLATATKHKGDPSLLRSFLGYAFLAAKKKFIPLSPDSLADLFDELEALDFPAIHHSVEYERLYAPAYRVVRISHFPALLAHQ